MKQLCIASLLLASAAVLSSSPSPLVTMAVAEGTAISTANMCPNGSLSGSFVVAPPANGRAITQYAEGCAVSANSVLRYSPNGFQSEASGGNGGTLSLTVRQGTFGDGSSLRFTAAMSNSVKMSISVEGNVFAGSARIEFDASFELTTGSLVAILRNSFDGAGAGPDQTYACPIDVRPVIGDGVSFSITDNSISCLADRDNAQTAQPAVGINVVPTRVGVGLVFHVWFASVTFCNAAGAPAPTGLVINGAVTGRYSSVRNSFFAASSAQPAAAITMTGTFGHDTGSTRSPGLSCSGSAITGDFAGAPIQVVSRGGSPIIDIVDNVISSRKGPEIRASALSPTGPVYVRFLRNDLTSSTTTPRLVLQVPRARADSVVHLLQNKLQLLSEGGMIDPRAAVGPYILFDGTFTTDAKAVVEFDTNTVVTAPLGASTNQFVGWSVMPVAGTANGPLYFCDNTFDGRTLNTLRLLSESSTNLPTGSPLFECPQMPFPRDNDEEIPIAVTVPDVVPTTTATVKPTVYTGAAPLAATAATTVAMCCIGLLSALVNVMA